MNSLTNIDFWKKRLGLLPIKLFGASQTSIQNYILLNGGHGDFCLQTGVEEGQPLDSFYSHSWSSNTKNYVVLDGQRIKIFNWKKNTEEDVSAKQVEENFEQFHKYLISNNYRSETDIVPFIIDIFKGFRNITQEQVNAIEALNLLFLLLVTLEEDISTINYEDWGIRNVNVPTNFEQFITKLKSGVKDLEPSLNLIMRHSAGALFQEAQKEVLFFDHQLDIWGSPSSKYESKKLLYSSIHYTPSYLARTIVENALLSLNLEGKSSLKIFDPACGSSEFLMEVLKQLSELNYQGTIEIIGWDSSEAAIQTSIFLLTYEKKNVWNDRLSFEINLVKDSLKEDWQSDYDLILMNPPFVSWDQMDKSSREGVREALNSCFTGSPNQASAFFYKAVMALTANGVIGSVIPSSILTLDAYKKLRDKLSSTLNIKIVGKLGNFIFEDAFTDVSFIVGSKSISNSSPKVVWTKNEEKIADNALRDLRKMHYQNLSAINERQYSIYTPVSFPITKENWKPISYNENELLKKIERFATEGAFARVIDVFNVSQGIRTGSNPVFKISNEQFSDLPEEEKKYFRPVFDNDAFKNGRLVRKNFVWYPYDEEGISITSEVELEQKVPKFYSYLYKFREDLIDRADIDRSNWWHLSKYRTWLRKKEPRLISTEFGNSSSFVFDQEGIFAIERGNAWLPKKEFSISDYYYYLALFSNSFFDRLLSIYSKELAGGRWYDLGKKYTSSIPIPDIHNKNVKISDTYEKLSALGKELSEGNANAVTMIENIVKRSVYPF